MPTKSKIDAIEERIARLHGERFKPPLQRWIETQDTEALFALRVEMERGTPLLAAIDNVLQSGRG